jgi:CheY-like chemotaxis protein
METAKPLPPLVIAVVEDNPADVYFIARVLQAHGLQYLLQVLETRQRALHFFDQLVGQNIRCPDLVLLGFTLPGLDTRELLQWIRAVPACRGLCIIVMTGSDDPTLEQEALAFGADAFLSEASEFPQVHGIRRPHQSRGV